MITFLILAFTAIHTPLTWSSSFLPYFCYGVGSTIAGFIAYNIFRNRLPQTPLDLPWILLVFVALISAHFSIWPIASEVRLFTILGYIIAFYFVYTFVPRQILVHQMLIAGWILATVCVALSIYHFYNPPISLRDLGNRNVLAAILLLIIPFGVKIKEWDYRLIWFIWTGWAMVTTTSRGGLLGLAMALGILWSIDRRLIVGASAAALPVLIIWKRGSAMIRLCYWEAAIQAFLSRPLFGIGPAACYQWITPVCKPCPHAHNIFLTIGAEMGIAGLLVLAFLIWQTWRHRRPGPELAALTGFMVHSLVDDPIWFWSVGLGVMSLLAIMVKEDG